jgi:hypothetical protein
MTRPRTPPEQRFGELYMPDPNSGCWLWLGHLDLGGYGRFRLAPDKAVPKGAHVASYVLHYGDVPSDLCVCHKCDVRSCVNPKHLFLGTYKDNMQDASKKGRMMWKPKDRPTLPKGSDHWAAKLTPADVIAIRSSKETGVAVARRFGVSPKTISRIRRGQNWRHVS